MQKAFWQTCTPWFLVGRSRHTPGVRCSHGGYIFPNCYIFSLFKNFLKKDEKTVLNSKHFFKLALVAYLGVTKSTWVDVYLNFALRAKFAGFQIKMIDQNISIIVIVFFKLSFFVLSSCSFKLFQPSQTKIGR